MGQFAVQGAPMTPSNKRAPRAAPPQGEPKCNILRYGPNIHTTYCSMLHYGPNIMDRRDAADRAKED